MFAPDRPRRLKVQLGCLRLFLAILLTGLPGALLPAMAFEKFSWLMGYGQPPLTPLTIYLSGNAGYAYTALAILVWVVARDLRRYQPLVRAIGGILVLVGPAYLSIDLQCPLPLWWTLIDSLGCFGLGTVLLWATPQEIDKTAAP